ncbi:double-stranded RNA binding motif domain-containing protein [Aspergillus chevalieri]|uniref:DRBM domain-containing protein n=1 Tax=Aspergillus chevalieri TaxID=182096 RepID=A0A7R7VM70_ASPCH|nr:uncharacterized protein ACHE_31106S [Aspergillus chevalieri]BCR87119.1 hypothetical protein ACHE_31106S [Aspergillus chevalieri]
MTYGSNSQETGGRWQWLLENFCRNAKMPPPFFEDCSDRRGGRTAWSSVVKVQGRTFRARYWYDGNYVHNAREDAAEVALMVFKREKEMTGTIASAPDQGQIENQMADANASTPFQGQLRTWPQMWPY